jgi:hypothetical protein
MSLLSYESARPWAKAMKNAVLTRKMPPWFADAQYGHFKNDRSLKQVDINTIAQWADAGAPEGNPKDAPAAVKWPADGWEIQPDFVVNGPEVAVPAKPKANVIEWTYITVPSGFKEDTWVTSMEIRPQRAFGHPPHLRLLQAAHRGHGVQQARVVAAPAGRERLGASRSRRWRMDGICRSRCWREPMVPEGLLRPGAVHAGLPVVSCGEADQGGQRYGVPASLHAERHRMWSIVRGWASRWRRLRPNAPT